MITANELYEAINQFAPFETAMSFDNVGILIGSSETSSDSVLTALDATKSVLEEAVRKNIRMILTHHPVIFEPLRQLREDSIPYLAVKYGLTILSAHTNLDIAPGGVNDTLAECIGVRADQHTDEECTLIGTLDRPMDAVTFAGQIKERLRLRGLRFTDTKKELHRVLVACGAGGGSIGLAVKCGADALVTGEIKHHQIGFANDHGIAVFDLGHFQSEDMIIPVLTERLNRLFPGTAFIRAESDTDGVYYI